MFVVTFLCWLGWLSGIVLGQFGLHETVSSSVSFPDLGLTCFRNLAVFFSSFLRGRIYWEFGGKDLLAILTAPKLENIDEVEDMDGFGLTTCEFGNLSDCSVVMLSKESHRIFPSYRMSNPLA